MNGSDFLNNYSEAVLTSISFFWKALWAFILGYIVSSMIQVFVTRQRMKQAMGDAGKKSIALGTFFGFISSSCSFAALSTTKSLFKKGAGFVPSLAFLLASTNLVIELGFIIAIFLGWQFVVGEYIGGILLILIVWQIVRFTRPKKLLKQVRRKLNQEEGENQSDGEVPDWQEKIQSQAAWQQVARKYFMEWGMVWKDVTFGFTVAGIIAAFVPNSFFQTLFIGSGQNASPGFFAILEHTIVGPVAAFLTFIGSMGNIPLASILYGNGVSFAGVMAFIFSDLVVFPVIRVNVKYYGWKLALYILGIFLAALVITSLILHYGFSLLGLLPQSSGQTAAQTDRFAIDYTFWLNLLFLGITGFLVWLSQQSQSEKDESQGKDEHHHHHSNQSVLDKILFWLAILSYIWLLGGIIVTIIS